MKVSKNLTIFFKKRQIYAIFILVWLNMEVMYSVGRIGGEKMRIQFEFAIDKMPLAYRLGMLSMVKEMIKKGSPAYFEKVFQAQSQKMKPFSFATYIKDLQIEKDEIYGQSLHLTVSSPSYEFIMYLMNGSEREHTYRYKDYSFTLKRKRLLPKPPTFSSNVLFKTLSPLLIEDKEKSPILSTDTDFEKELNYYASLLVEEIYQRPLQRPINVLHTSMKKVVIKEELHQVEKGPIYLTGNQGLIQLEGDPVDLQAIYDSGLGRRSSLGFGLLEIEGVN